MEEDGDIPHAERESAITGEMIASCIVPNMNKVSSIPEYLFRRHGIKRPIPYVTLKVVSWFFTYGIPLWALGLCANGLRINVMLRTEWPVWLRIVLVAALLAVALIAFACMFVQLLSDVEWTRKMIVDSKKQ
jgi:hypothetical protein